MVTLPRAQDYVVKAISNWKVRQSPILPSEFFKTHVEALRDFKSDTNSSQGIESLQPKTPSSETETDLYGLPGLDPEHK